jgi:hypothetical protein
MLSLMLVRLSKIGRVESIQRQAADLSCGRELGANMMVREAYWSGK